MKLLKIQCKFLEQRRTSSVQDVTSAFSCLLAPQRLTGEVLCNMYIE